MYWYSRYRDKMVRPSYVYNENSYTRESTSLYWEGPQDLDKQVIAQSIIT